LSSIPVFSSEFRLEPFVADIGEAPLVAQSSEVARIVEAPLSELCGGPHIDAVPYQRKGRSWLSPVFVIEGLAVFGATAHCLLELLDLLAPLGGLDRPPLVAGRFDWPCLFRHGARAGEAMGR